MDDAQTGLIGRFETRFYDGETECSVDWHWVREKKFRDPDPVPQWEMCSRESRSWMCDGNLTEVGRAKLLTCFDLETLAHHLPLEVLRFTHPSILILLRTCLDGTLGPHTPTNDFRGKVIVTT